MTVLIATVGGYVCSLMLLVAGVVHAANGRKFETVLRQQRLVPTGFVRVSATAVVALELTLGGAGVIALGVAPSEAAARPVLAAAAALFAVYAGYTARLFLHARGVPCGCSTADYPVNAAVVARAAGLSVAAIAAAGAAGQMLEPAATVEFSLIVVASIGLSVILWTLPAALADPTAARAPAPMPKIHSLGRSH